MRDNDETEISYGFGFGTAGVDDYGRDGGMKIRIVPKADGRYRFYFKQDAVS